MVFYLVILHNFFFPPEYFQNSLLLTFGSFAAGYIMRPFGGIVFGYIGDKFGRKKALIISIAFVSIPTAIIGCLPTYNQIGIISPILLLLCRLVQGICVAGEYSGACIYFYEHSQKKHRAFMCGVMCATAFFGALLATLVATGCIHNSMPTWGWRIAFLLGASLGPISFILRRRMQETNEFLILQKNSATLKMPIIQVFKNRKKSIIAAACVGAQGHIPLYISTVYTNTTLTKLVGTEKWLVTLDNCLLLCLWVITILISARIADHIGKEKIMITCGILIAIIAFPMYSFVFTHPSIFSVVTLQVVFSLLGAAYIGPSASFLPELFQPYERYSGIGFSLTLGQALIGGMTPMIAATLVNFFANEKAAAILVIIGGILGVLSCTLSPKTLLQHTKEPSKLKGIMQPGDRA